MLFKLQNMLHIINIFVNIILIREFISIILFCFVHLEELIIKKSAQYNTF
jgi:hypothetical protein